ncbi:caspase a-like isoform X2 [Lampris incognitus]|uniref:caspase a-like isoform X2 n=1 Tax=Lampris incognitus TaxID=2546036 RepID=UPI0024B563C3|nr:caspase a-like isoform X2 [Lampris incognitus]
MAGKELFRVRVDFIKTVPQAVIDDLLGDLLALKVLNNEEKDSVTEDNHSRANKARSLIDFVIKKGDVASAVMIGQLKIRDASLHTNLGLSSWLPAQTAVSLVSMKEQGLPGSSNLISSTKASQKENIYPVTDQSMKSRMALLITNMKFDNKDLNRAGADKDEENMETLLKSWKYDVVKHRDLSGQEIDKAVKEFSRHVNLPQTDSVFVVIMSHGIMGAVLGVHWKEAEPDMFPIDNIYKHLNTRNCQALLNKPKVIIIQACRGGEKGAVLVSDGPGVTRDRIPPLVCDTEHQASLPGFTDDVMDDALHLAHKEKDFITLLSCTPGPLQV